MSIDASHSLQPTLDGVVQDIHRLNELLQQEFEALKSRQIEVVHQLEHEKVTLLKRLNEHTEPIWGADDLSEEWISARDDLRLCRDMHFRNIQLLRRQLDAVQGALQTLAGGSDGVSPIYDRLGQVRRASGARAYQAA